MFASVATSSRLVAAKPKRAKARVAAARICSRRAVRRSRGPDPGTAQTGESDGVLRSSALDIVYSRVYNHECSYESIPQDRVDRHPVRLKEDDMTNAALLPTLPFEQPTPLSVAPLLRALQAERPITRVRTSVGDGAWLVTRYSEVKELLADPRLGRSHPDPEHAPRFSDSILFGGPMERYETEQADHAQMRALLTPFFSAKRMQDLRPRVEALVDQFLDALAARTPPVDLHEGLSFPLPVLVICELLGVPFADRERFRIWSTAIADLYDRARASASSRSLNAYMRELVERKRAQPEDDV